MSRSVISSPFSRHIIRCPGPLFCVLAYQFSLNQPLKLIKLINIGLPPNLIDKPTIRNLDVIVFVINHLGLVAFLNLSTLHRHVKLAERACRYLW